MTPHPLSKREHMALEMWREIYRVNQPLADRDSRQLADYQPPSPGGYARVVIQHVDALLAELERGQTDYAHKSPAWENLPRDGVQK